MPGRVRECLRDVGKGGLDLALEIAPIRPAHPLAVEQDGSQARPDVGRGQDQVHEPCRDGAVGHAGKAGARALLRNGHAAPRLDLPQSLRAVAARTRKDHAIGVPALLLRERRKECIDRPENRLSCVATLQGEPIPMNTSLLAGRDHHDGLCADGGAILNLGNGDRGAVGQDLVKDRGMAGREVLDHDVAGTRSRLDARYDLTQCLDAARRCADGHDRNLLLRPGHGFL